MIERILILAVLFALGFIGYTLFTRRQLNKAQATIPTDPILDGKSLNVPTVVYFTTPDCAPCRFQLKPTLDRLQIQLGETGLQVIGVDATVNPEAADRWGVFSVPTTFVLDTQGQPTIVYNGVVSESKLREQIVAVSA